MFLCINTQQTRAEQRSGSQIERLMRFLFDKAHHLSFRNREMSHCEVRLTRDHLHRLLGFHCKPGAQRFVTPYQFAQGSLQRLHVKTALETNGDRQVIRDALRLQLVKKPETILRKRQRIRRCLSSASNSNGTRWAKLLFFE